MTEAELFFEENAMGGVSLLMLDGSELFPRDVRWAGPGAAEAVADYDLPNGKTMTRHVSIGKDVWAIGGRVALNARTDVDMVPSSLN